MTFYFTNSSAFQFSLRKHSQHVLSGLLQWIIMAFVPYDNNTNGSGGRTIRFDNDCWHAYQRVNRMFSKAVVCNCDDHLIWVHDYHLILLPYYYRVKLSGVKIGFYLHIPWPNSEIFRQLPVRNEANELVSATLARCT